jgi:hypothetical protein
MQEGETRAYTAQDSHAFTGSSSYVIPPIEFWRKGR